MITTGIRISGARQAALLLTAASLLVGTAPVAAALPSETVDARRHFFGAENVSADGAVRKDRVILSWFSVGSLAASFRGHVVLLDSYIHKEEDVPNYVPTTTDETVALRPEAVFLGHGHFDHAATGGEVVARTGAVLVGTPEHCDQTRQQAAVYAGRSIDIRCRKATSRGAAPGQRKTLRPFGQRVEVTALKHVHSAAEPPDGEFHETTAGSGPFPDARLLLLHPPGPSLLEHLTIDGDEGGTILYQFRVGRFSLVWHDSAGPLREEAPQVFDALRSLPATDVEVGAVLGFNDPTNGLRDPVDYVETLRPKVFYPLHHDFITEYGASQRTRGVMAREMARRGDLPTELRWLYDPYDYLRPGLMTFAPGAPRWDDRRDRGS